MQPRETDFVGRGVVWSGAARSTPINDQTRPQEAFRLAQGHPEDKAARQRRLDRTVRELLRRAWSTGRRRGATRPGRRQRATASRPLAGPRPARTLTHSPRDTSSCTSDGPLISCSRSCTRSGHRGQRAYSCLVAAEGLCTNAGITPRASCRLRLGIDG